MPGADAVALGGIDGFREAVSGAFVPLEVTSRHPDRFRAHLHHATAGAVEVTEVAAGEHVVERTAPLVAAGGGAHYKVGVQLQGRCLLVQNGRETLLGPGDAAVYDTSRPYTMAFDDEFRALVVMVRHDAFGLPEPLVQEVLAAPFSAGTGVGALAVPFLVGLSDRWGELGEASRHRLAAHAVDLLATMVASEVGTTVGDPARHDLLHRIKRWVEEHLGEHDLDPAAIAAAHFVSTRHLHALFHDDGTTVGSWLRERRLERARRDLLDPSLAPRSVGATALRCGFADLAHFSRAYKARFGETPSRTRAGAAVPVVRAGATGVRSRANGSGPG